MEGKEGKISPKKEIIKEGKDTGTVTFKAKNSLAPTLSTNAHLFETSKQDGEHDKMEGIKR